MAALEQHQFDTAKLTRIERDEKPWKYVGYPGFSIFLAGDPDRLVVRRFDELHTRLILVAQDELSDLEERLQEIDARYAAKGATDINNGSVRRDKRERKQLLQAVKPILAEYGRMVLQYSQLRLRPEASGESINNIRNWFYNNHGAILEEETRFINHTDLIAIQDQTKSGLRRLADPLIARLSKGPLRMLRRENSGEVDSMNEATVSCSNDHRVDQVADILALVVGLVLLIAPLWILQTVGSNLGKLGVVTCFVVVFLLILSFAMVGSPYQVLAATAGYAAVLAVFLQP